jgi:2-octaprenyl-6-methoxyphenol hydroxylase
MKVCIIGDGLVSLTLANVLIKRDLCVDIISDNKFKKYDKTRTLGISNTNIEFLNQNVAGIKNILWEIKNIKIYTEKSLNDEILHFTDKSKKIFSILKNTKLKKILEIKLKNNKLVKFKNNIDYKKIIKEKYKLIINCDSRHELSKKFFSNIIEKKYNSCAYTTLINHKKIRKNHDAIQIFTKNGPIAYLPVSETQTSVVYSFKKINHENELKIKNLIKKFNPKYKIVNIEDFGKFKLKSKHLRNYYNNNILAFGDLLHKIHPLAGQGFNMSLRDIKVLTKLIDDRINIGLDIDHSICSEFEKTLRHKNLIFSMGIDWIYEIFNYESKLDNQFLIKSVNIIGNNKLFNFLIKRFADSGLRF